MGTRTRPLPGRLNGSVPNALCTFTNSRIQSASIWKKAIAFVNGGRRHVFVVDRPAERTAFRGPGWLRCRCNAAPGCRERVVISRVLFTRSETCEGRTIWGGTSSVPSRDFLLNDNETRPIRDSAVFRRLILKSRHRDLDLVRHAALRQRRSALASRGATCHRCLWNRRKRVRDAANACPFLIVLQGCMMQAAASRQRGDRAGRGCWAFRVCRSV